MSGKPALNPLTPERRRAERIPLLHVEARLGPADGVVLGTVRNVSECGAFIETRVNPRAPEFQLTLLVGDASPPVQIRTFAQWTRSTATGIGVRFLAIDADDFKRLCAPAAYQAALRANFS